MSGKKTDLKIKMTPIFLVTSIQLINDFA